MRVDNMTRIWIRKKNLLMKSRHASSQEEQHETPDEGDETVLRRRHLDGP